MKAIRLAVIASHPIQYQTPWFRALDARPELSVEVLYCHAATKREQAHAGFGVEFDWDIPLLDGYPNRFLPNVSREPSVSTFRGVDTPAIGGIIRDGCFDAAIVLGWQHKAFAQAIWACVRTRTPVLVRGDSHLRTPRSLARAALKWAPYRWFFQRLDGCVAVGSWSRDYFLHYGVRRDLISIVPHTVDVEHISSEAQRLDGVRASLRSAWGMTGDDPVFLFAAKFIEKKRPLDFVRAVHVATSQGGRMRGLMVGDGPLRATCMEYARRYSVPITFAGFLNQSEIIGAYVAADALVLPSDGGETWGLVVNEAMACGRPSFVSDHVGCGPDLVIPGVTGDIFELGNVDAMAAKLRAYTGNSDMLASMGRHARARSQSHTPAAAAAATVEAIARIVDARAARGSRSGNAESR